MKGIGPTTYINASLIRAKSSEDAKVMCIASQAPLESGFQAFWGMVWKYEVTDIFCLTKTQENGNMLASVYWKNYEPEIEEEFKIEVVSKEEELFTIRRVIDITSTSSNITKTIVHHHITCWDDDKVLTNLANIEDLMTMLETLADKLALPNSKPVLAHCSAGIGRTGVFIALAEIISRLKTLRSKYPKLSLDEICSQAESEAEISVFDIVRSIREQRWGSVKSLVRTV